MKYLATIINNPQPVESQNNGMGFLLGVILLIVVGFLLFYYGLPVVRGTIGGYSAAPQVNVPAKVDVNVNHSGTGK